MTTARAVVRAIVVTDGRSGHLPAVLASLADHSYDTLDVVVVDGDEPDFPDGLRGEILRADGANYREAIDAAVATHPALDQELLWLLHDDTAPMPGALDALAAVARKRRRAAIVGAAHVNWRDPSRLVDLGATVSRVGARRIQLVEEDDVNQGQYDSRDDVLAVSLAGALVRREWWDRAGGTDDAYRGFGESVDLCRRAWRAGLDVVVVPSARIRHAQENLHGTRAGGEQDRRSSYPQRRTGEWYHAMAFAPALGVPLLVLWAFVSAPVRALLRIAQNEPRMALADLGVPWRVLGRLGRLPASRAAIRRTQELGPRVERPLLAPWRTVVRFVRARELGAYEQWRESIAPNDVERAELALAASRRRRGLAITGALGLAASLAFGGAWLGPVLRGDMLAGGILGVTDLAAGDVWARLVSGWDGAGFGAASIDSVYAALLLPASVVPGGARVGLALTLVLAPLAATLGGWAAAGTAVRSAWIRGAAALAYGLWPAFLVSVDDGRLGAVLAHVLLPWVAFGLVRGAGWHRGEPVGDGEFPRVRVGSPSASAGAAVAAAAAVSAAPALLPAVVLVALVAGGFARGARLRTWAIALPALLVSAPALVAAWHEGTWGGAARVLLRDAGPVAASQPSEPWELLLGAPTPQTALPWADLAPTAGAAALAVGALVVLGAAWAVLSGRATWPVRTLVLLASVGLATALVEQRTLVGGEDGAGMELVNGWPGPGSSLMALALLGAAASAASGAWGQGKGAALAWRRTGYAVVLGVAALALSAHALVVAWPGRPTDLGTTDVAVLPLATALDQVSGERQRVLVLDSAEDGTVAYTVLETDGSVHALGTAERDDDGRAYAHPTDPPPATPASLGEAVATLAGAGSGASPSLAAWGIGTVVVAPGATELDAALSQIEELDLLGASDRGTPYRVTWEDDARATRAWVEVGDARTAVPMGRLSGTIELAESVDGTLVLAVADDRAWTATLDGEPLARVDDPLGRAAWKVAGSGQLEIVHHDPTRARWLWIVAGFVGFTLLGSIPIHRTRFGRGAR
ncbi:glycosyltransferase [Demequina sp. NBRC 110052]|uniref:glycosyltransferase n=1 Tax=Demequina sp. NBRC 110052 TaxID=1570341 RepID=UPI000A02BFDE|nr:glycosyltransferase [Demequina sp. NBRC 110052]